MSVSTEVQRTLVKSPPELWAELSDPAALARHLSDLGELRITRVEPEQTVEWEATALDGTHASGKVEISPSGWGTKVTFSATRAVGEPPQDHRPASQPDPPADAAPAATDDPFAQTHQAEPDPFAEITSPAQPDPPKTADPLAEDHPATDEDLLTDDDPLTDGTLEDDELLDDAFEDGESYGDDLDDEEGVLAEHELSSGLAGQPDPASLAPDRPQSRRGFFARLFGLRRRDSAPAAGEAELAPARAFGADEEIAGALPADTLPPPELPSAMAIAEQVTQPYEAVGAVPPDAERPGPGPERPMLGLDETADAPGELERRAPREPFPSHEGESCEPASAPRHAAQPADDLQRAQPAAQLPVGEGPTGAPERPHAAPEITRELEAAEEVAAEHVTAVLTSALDHLGAAHHRPFSRG